MTRAVIFGLSSTALTPEEKRFFRDVEPLGFILFSRNCESPPQIRALTESLRDLTGEKNTPILIDQEGGRVARLKPPHWRKCPPAQVFTILDKDDGKAAEQATFLNYRLIAEDLASLGINVDCAPVVDLLFADAHDIVGDRAFGATPEQVARLARKACEGLLAGGVIPVIKHIPGHGRARCDSHAELPVVSASVKELTQSDFAPFKLLADQPWAMTAHILYTDLDAKEPATLSKKMIRLIRKDIGFDGVLISDDLSMNALKGTLAERAKKTVKAGCDVLLHCNGKLAEMQEVAKEAPKISKQINARLARGFAMLPKRKETLDVAATTKKLQQLIGEDWSQIASSANRYLAT